MKALVILAVVASTMALPHFPLRGVPHRIVGGEEAVPNEFPWQISMRYNGQHLCGGSIYNADTIITAAHCGEFASASAFSILAGKHNLGLTEDGQQSRQVSDVHLHPGYPGATGFSNDIAILKLTMPLTFSATVGPVPIAPVGHTATGDATVTGWGTTREGGVASLTLQKVDVPIVTDTACRQAYGADMIDDSMICAGLAEGGKDSCQGDSGGPFLANDRGTGRYLAGIVSWGYGCARPGYPGVYAEISHFNNFILQHA